MVTDPNAPPKKRGAMTSIVPLESSKNMTRILFLEKNNFFTKKTAFFQKTTCLGKKVV